MKTPTSTMTTSTPNHNTSSMNFEIRIAILGTPQAGNSTIVNSILGSEYCPVGKASSCVNIFDIFSSANTSKEDNGVDESTPKRHESEDDHDHGSYANEAESIYTTGATQKIRSAKSVYKRIRKDNKKYREEQIIVREKHHLIEPSSSSIFAQTSIRDDTKIYVLDVPGIFCDDVSRKKFIPYINDKWCTFDIVIVVLDVQSWTNDNACNNDGGSDKLPNKSPQVELLKFVDDNLMNQKRIPTIVVANKADSPLDKSDRSVLPTIKSLRDLSIDTFGVSCSRSTLIEVLLDNIRWSWGGGIDKKLLDCGPIFLPNSTQVAYSYKLDIPMSIKASNNIDISGGEGDNRKSSMKRKHDMTEKSVTFASEEVVDPFLSLLRYFMDGEQAQKHLLSRQIDFQLESMTISHNDLSPMRIVDDLEVLFHRCGVIGRTTTDFGKRFWKLYNSCEDTAKAKLETIVDPRLFERPFQELEAYHAFATRIDCSHTVQMTLIRMKELLRYQYNLLIRKQIDWSFIEFCQQTNHSIQQKVFRCGRGGEYCGRSTGTNHCKQQLLIGVEGCQIGTYCGKSLKVMGTRWTVPDQTTWTNLSPYDWNTILFSVLSLPPSDIYRHFGQELRALKDAEYSFRSNRNPPHVTRQQLRRQQVEMEIYEDSISTMMITIESSSPKTTSTTCTTTQPLVGSTETSATAGLDALDKIPIPDDISDPSHWGYLSWKYITFYKHHVQG